MFMSSLLFHAFCETFYMVLAAGLIASAMGIPLGFILFTTRQKGILSHVYLQRTLSLVLNALRSIPFIILLVLILTLYRLIVV